MMRRVLCAIAACACLTAVSHATVLLPADFREIVTGSELIAYGRVVELETEWSPDRRRIDTIVTVEVGTWLKGGDGERVVFKVPGGQIGRYRSVMVGAPTFRTGDEAVWFLNRKGAPTAHVFGLNQGVFRVRRDPRTLQRMVTPPVMARSESAERLVRGAATRQSVTLETFGAQVRAVLAETKASAR